MQEKAIRQAKVEDMAQIQQIYQLARQFMVDHGNPTQWRSGYPWVDLLLEDIRSNRLYVVLEKDTICGVFVFSVGEDPTYGYMEGGAWRSQKPYGTIHRIASRGSGVFHACVEFCRKQCAHLRIDTHADNLPMQHLILKHGFSRRGIIYVEDGTPRIAYDLL